MMQRLRGQWLGVICIQCKHHCMPLEGYVFSNGILCIPWLGHYSLVVGRSLRIKELELMYSEVNMIMILELTI